jgi:cytochrome c-type biogenesis protein CcmH
MSLFIFLSLLMVGVVVVLLMQPRRRPANLPPQEPARMDTPIDQIREQIRQLAELNASGELGDAQYQQSRSALERKLVDAVMAAPVAPAVASAPVGGPTARPSWRLLAAIGAFVLIVVVAGYAWLGTPAGVDTVGTPSRTVASGDGQASPHALSPEQIESMIDRLAARLKDNPDDVEGWVMLARSQAVSGRHAESVPAFRKAVALRGDDPTLLADFADALAVAQGGRIEGEALTVIEHALKIDPDNVKALALAGTAAFDRKDYAGAIRHWERLVARAPADNPLVERMKDGLDEARRLAGGAAQPAAKSAPVAAGGSAAGGAAAAASSASVSGTVRLAQELAGQAAPDDTLFVYARAAEGSRMPLAILRRQVKDLPLEFTLDDQLSMSPAARLSSASRVIVAARISKSGQATAQPGDLFGQSAVVSLGARGLQIEVREKVKAGS